MIKQNLKIFLFSSLLLALILPGFLVISQVTLDKNSTLKEDCQTLQECQELQQKLLEEIKKLEETMAQTEKKEKTLQNQISLYTSKIRQLELQIRQGNLMIRDLNYQIIDTESSIEKTSLKIEDLKEKLARVLKAIYEEEQKSFLEILLSEETLSSFFNKLMALESLNQENQELLREIKELKSNLENQKERLDEERDDLARIVQVQILQKQQSEEVRKEKDRVLKMTQAQYQQYLREKKELERRAKEIMARITQLTLPGLDVPRDPKQLYELAKWAGEAAGGVRPALILGLLEVESALGVNVGQCNCSGPAICRRPDLNYKQVMSSKQWAAFEAIVRELGLNPNTTPVSCYVEGGKVQMGGAMGPAQFMPNTWLNLGYKGAVENVTGIKPANPWRARDAFLAAALYLADFNAKTQNRQSEIGAVTAYLCGTSTMTTRCRRAGGEWYVKGVMKKAEEWQNWIKQGISS